MLARLSLVLAVLFAAGTAQAQAVYYVAVPTTPAAKPQLMTHETLWHLQKGAYIANRAPERDIVVCQLVVRNTGSLQSFTVAGKPFDADMLAACNAKAK